jgi:hypothetical protein
MTPLELLERVQSFGARLTVPEAGRIHIEAPEPLPDELMAELRQHKVELLALLRQEVDYAATACACPIPIGPTGNTQCPVCQLPLICLGCGWCRGVSSGSSFRQNVGLMDKCWKYHKRQSVRPFEGNKLPDSGSGQPM